MNPARASCYLRVGANDDAASVTPSVTSAMTAARLAQARWARSPLAQRLGLVRELRGLIAKNACQLAEASASARFRPMLESLTAEVLPLAEACRFLEREAGKLLRPRSLGRRGLPLWLAGVRSEIQREPFGVVLIIGPGNYPLLLPGVQLIQALVAGNAVWLKPGVGGTDAARALCDLITRAGFDPQLLALLPESPEAAREAIAARPDKVLFTGSAATGEKVLAQLAPHLVPATMELSGADAVIVRADADLDLAVKALVFGLRLNNGATCMSPRRVYVARSLATELEGRLARAFTTRVIRGNEAELFAQKDQSTLTPAAAGKLRPVLDDALAGGAHFVAGAILKNGSITAPLVLAGLSPEARLFQEDVFAPVLALVAVADDEEALARGNDSPHALGASIFTRDEAAGRLLAARLNVGVVTINDLIIPTADARLPFGARKRSGFGVTRGAEGLLELTTPKVIAVSRSHFRPAYEAPQPGDARLFQAYLRLSHGRGLKFRWGALVSLIRSISGRINVSRKEAA